ncbi:hypothetical protein M91_02304, partial [Bos mutus]
QTKMVEKLKFMPLESEALTVVNQPINGDVAKLMRSAGAPDSALGSAQVAPEVITAKCLHSEAVLLGPSSAR